MGASHRDTDPEGLFAGNDLGAAVFEGVADAVDMCGGADLRVARTQVAWARRRMFVTLWDPRQWVGEGGAPVVVSVALERRDPSPSWKQVIKVGPGLWQHHREIWSRSDLDDDLFDAIREAYVDCA